MKRLVKVLILSVLSLVSMVAFVACQNQTNATISLTTKYTVVRTGSEVEMSFATAKTQDGKEIDINYSVTFQDGSNVQVDGNTFTASKDGKYTVILSIDKEYGNQQKIAFVYANKTGTEYVINFPENMPTEAEWGRECILPYVQAEHVHDGTKVPVTLKVTDADNVAVDVLVERFVANKLGMYELNYTYGGLTLANHTIECVDTSAPVVVWRNNATVEPSYGQTYLLPYPAIIDADLDQSKTVVQIFREDDENSAIEIVNDRITIDASKYFTYRVYAEDTAGRGASYDLIINRKYDANIDSLDLLIDGDKVVWEDATQKTALYDGYYEVTGYEVSLDGGQTFNVSLDKTVTEYKINSTEFCNVVIRERNSGEREVSQSDSLCFDGGLSGDDVASFDIDEYANTVEVGSCKDFETNALYGLTYGIDTNSFKGATSGVLKANIPTYASIKITFAKSQQVKEDSVLVVRFYAENSSWSARISTYGKNSIGTSLDSYGLKDNYGKWVTLNIPVVSVLGATIGQPLAGVEFVFSGMIAIDDIKMVSLVSGLSGDQVANFDNSQYSALVSTSGNYEFNSQYKMSYEILDNGYANSSSGVLKIKALDYVAIQIKFAKSLTVKDDSTLTLKLYQQICDGANWSSARITKYDATGFNGGISLELTNGAWIDKSLLLTDIGYSVGETVEGIQLLVQGIEKDNNYSYLYVDEISAVSLSAELKGDQVANFDKPQYSALVGVCGNYEVNSQYNMSYEILNNGYANSSSGVLKVRASAYAAIQIKFVKAVTVKEDSTLILKAYQQIFDGANWSSVRIAKYEATGFNGGISLDLTNGAWIDKSLLLTDIGYSVGETVEGIQLLIQGDANNNSYLYVDEISVASLSNKLINNQLATFDSQDYESLISAGGNYEFNSANCMVFDVLTDGYAGKTSGVLKVESWAYTAVVIKFPQSFTVKEGDTILIKIYQEIWDSAEWLSARVAKYGASGVDPGIDLALTDGVWTNKVVSLADIGYNVGEVCEGIQIIIRGNYDDGAKVKYSSFVYIDEIKLLDTVETLVIGDSYASRTYWKTCETDLDSVDGYTIGIGGTTVEDWEAKISEIVAYNPKNIVIHLGVNDINRGQTGESTAQQLSAFIELLKQQLPNAQIIYVNICNNINYTHKHEQYLAHNQAIKTYIDGADNVTLVDFAKAQADNANLWANGGFIEGDTTHLTAEAYRTFADMVLSAINGLSAN